MTQSAGKSHVLSCVYAFHFVRVSEYVCWCFISSLLSHFLYAPRRLFFSCHSIILLHLLSNRLICSLPCCWRHKFGVSFYFHFNPTHSFTECTVSVVSSDLRKTFPIHNPGIMSIAWNVRVHDGVLAHRTHSLHAMYEWLKWLGSLMLLIFVFISEPIFSTSKYFLDELLLASKHLLRCQWNWRGQTTYRHCMHAWHRARQM